MDSNRRGSTGQWTSSGDPRTEPLVAAASPNPPPSALTPTWSGSVGTVHMPQSQNMNMASAGNNTVVNIINPTSHGQTATSQQEDLQDSTARADHEVYSSQLLTKKRGYPLWVPGPAMQLPIEYRRQGISIGDVGIITSTGEFDFLFNIFLPADHPINGQMVPQGFEPLPLQEFKRDIQRTAVYGPDTHLESASVRKITSSVHSASKPSTDHMFESTAKEAAILVLPHGATTYNLLNTWGVRLTISKKAKDWYTYARFTRGREVKNGDIRVVVGVDKASSWGIAISSCNTAQTASYVFKYDPTRSSKWDCTGGSGRAGPQKEETDDLIADGTTVLQNQCVFVRTINFTLSGKIWNDSSITSSGNLLRRHSASGKQRSPGERHSSWGSGNSPLGNQSLSKQGSSHSIRVNFDDVEPGANHPSIEIHNRLHEEFPQADVVITDDTAVLSDNDTVFFAHEPQNDWDIIHVGRKDETTIRASSSMNLGHMSTLDGAGTPLTSESEDDESPREDENGTNPTALDSSVAHESELLPLDPCQESVKVQNEDSIGRGNEPPQDDASSNESESSDASDLGGLLGGPITVGGPSLARNDTEISVGISSEENSLNDSREERPAMEQGLTSQEGSDDLESVLNHDPSIELLNVRTDNSKTTAKPRHVPNYFSDPSFAYFEYSPATPTLPELPMIENFDLRLDVLTHKDLRPNSPSLARPWGDNERLGVLGASVLKTVVTSHFFSKPSSRALQEKYTSPNMLNSWLDLYQLKRKFTVPPNQSDAIYNDLNQMASYFHSYVGAVFITKGKGEPAIQTWITGLINRDENVGPLTEQNTAFPGHASTSNSGPSPSSTSNLSTISLSFVNQTASQRGLSITYVPSHEGPSHQPIWTVRCYINDAEKGMGVGMTLKIAKEEAARQTYLAMGWSL